VRLDDGQDIGYEKLLICMGASPTMPSLPGLERERCFVLRTLADADGMLAELSARSKEIAILGAGPVGVEVAVALKKRGFRVTLIGRSRIMRRLFDPDFSEAIGHILIKEGVTVLLGQNIREVRGAPPRGVVVVTDAARIASDMLIVAWGVKPNLDFLRGSGIARGESGGIAVDDKMRTSVDHVYAAGDCVETVDYVTGGRGINAIWPEAVLQGRIAAFNIIGGDAVYPGGVSRNVVNVFGTPVFSAGSLVGDKRTIVTPLSRVRYTVADGRIVGVQVIGEPRRGGIVSPILKRATHPEWLLGTRGLSAARAPLKTNHVSIL
jgi:NADPH-dependent 2,4-dienoyl-CoA reductase/sulfur reductase-like enzyme